MDISKELTKIEEVGHKLRNEGFNIFCDQRGILLVSRKDITEIERALFAIDQVLDISYSTAEHHPYWTLLYNSAEICKKTLEYWNDRLTDDGIEEIKWRANKLKEFVDLLAVDQTEG